MSSSRTVVSIAVILLMAAIATPLAQAPEPAPPEKQVSFKDPLDGKFDLSERLIETHGFVPVPIIISEPALGGFGGGGAAVFLHKKPPVVINGETVPVPPDITTVGGAYTANNSWFGMGGRMATIEKHRLRYRAFGAYADMNIEFYPTDPQGNVRPVEFNGRAAPVYLNLMRQLPDPRFSFGAQYFLANAKFKLANGGDLPDSIAAAELDNLISTLGAVAEYDGRDNIFTPDSGLMLHAHFDWSDDWLGSDVRYGRLNTFAYWYRPLKQWSDDRNWISGLRADYQQSFEDPPFYLVPYINLRGVPAARYQGKRDVVLETEQRIDVTRRWSLVLFGGIGKAFDQWSDADDAELVYGAGTGVRYLIARRFKLRMGVDVAVGPEEWAYYIVFGSNWMR